MKQIPLTQNQFALVDDDMFDALSQYKWCAAFNTGSDAFYAARGASLRPGGSKIRQMSHMVVGVPSGRFVVDHLNGNTLDNRRENLRTIPTRLNRGTIDTDIEQDV